MCGLGKEQTEKYSKMDTGVVVKISTKCQTTYSELKIGDVDVMPNRLKFEIIEHMKSIAKNYFIKSDYLLAVDKYDYALNICESID